MQHYSDSETLSQFSFDNSDDDSITEEVDFSQYVTKDSKSPKKPVDDMTRNTRKRTNKNKQHKRRIVFSEESVDEEDEEMNIITTEPEVKEEKKEEGIEGKFVLGKIKVHKKVPTPSVKSMQAPQNQLELDRKVPLQEISQSKTISPVSDISSDWGRIISSANSDEIPTYFGSGIEFTSRGSIQRQSPIPQRLLQSSYEKPHPVDDVHSPQQRVGPIIRDSPPSISTERVQIIEMKYDVSRIVVNSLQLYYDKGYIRSKEEFKRLARNFTNFIVDKEMAFGTCVITDEIKIAIRSHIENKMECAYFG